MKALDWKTPQPDVMEAIIGNEKDNDFVSFTIQHLPTCHRRGPFKLLIEVCGHDWGCFDDQDQPARWYHKIDNAKSEAQEIANVLTKERNEQLRSRD